MSVLSWDNIHSAILLIGTWLLISWGIEVNARILPWLGLVAAWVLGYWGFVKLILPEEMSP